MKDDGGPAFPVDIVHGDGSMTYHPGMSLRDWFAGMATDADVKRWLPKAEAEVGLGGNPREYAKYLYADAMMKARKV